MNKWLLSILLVLGFQKGIAQQKPPTSEVVQANICYGEFTGELFRGLSTEIRENGKPIILIARLGGGETARDLNRERLRRAQAGINLINAHDNVVKAEGERVKGKGRVEIYVDGALRLTLLADRNLYICIGCCEGCVEVPRWYKPKRRTETACPRP